MTPASQRARELWNTLDQLRRQKHWEADGIHAITAALLERERVVWKGLKVTNKQLEWALTQLGPTGTKDEAYVKAAVLYVIACRAQAKLEEA